MHIQFATKKVDGAYEVAVIVDGKFARSGNGPDLMPLLSRLCGPLINTLDGEGSEVAVNINVFTAAEVERANARAERQRQAQDANAEAEEIERLTKAVQRENKARFDAERQVEDDAIPF